MWSICKEELEWIAPYECKRLLLTLLLKTVSCSGGCGKRGTVRYSLMRKADGGGMKDDIRKATKTKETWPICKEKL